MTASASARDRVRILLDRYSGRPMLVAIAAMNLITGGVAAWILAPLSFGSDVDFLRRGGQGLLDGTPVHDFVFSPLCAALAVPLALMPAMAASITITMLELGILLLGVRLETARLRPMDRLLVGVAVVTAVPVVNELLLGQVTLLIAASIYPLRDGDGRVRGVPLGIALALVPKPLLLPLLAWMIVWRRRALAGAIASAAILTLAGLILIGPGAYAAWVDALEGAGRISREANFSIWSSGLTVPAAAVAALVLAAFAWSLAEPRRGFVGALTAALLLAPYTLLYAASILVLAVKPALAVAPRATRALALIVNPATLAAAPAWIGAGLVAAAWYPAPRQSDPDA